MSLQEERVRWHSDYYRSGSRVGDRFKMMWLDALAEHPEGMSVPQVVEFVMSGPQKGPTASWCLSYGEEQKRRPDVKQTQLQARYYNQAWSESLSKDDMIRVVLTERLRYYGLKLVHPNVGVLARTGRFHDVRKSDFFNIMNGTADGYRRKAPIYVKGPKPLKVQQAGKGYAIYDPTQIDWDVRRNQLEAEAVQLLNDGRTSPRGRRFAAEVLKVLWKDERPEPLTFVTRPLEDEG